MTPLLIDAGALDRLNRKLADYQRVFGRLTVPEVMEKKGNDLRIQVFKLFREERFGGGSGRRTGIAWRELKRRSKAGLGTLVRDRHLNDRWGAPPELTAGKKEKPHKLTLWQKLVWQETLRRQRGIGALAAGFISKRFREPKTGRYLVENRSRTLGTMVEIRKDDTSFTISGFTPGLVEVANGNDIANRAIREVEKDIDKYLARKYEEARKLVFN